MTNRTASPSDVAPIRRLPLLLVTLLCVAWTAAAWAAGPSTQIDNARIRLLPGDLPLAGYFELTNNGQHTLTLTGASSPAFRRVMMHHSVHQNGQDRMLPVAKMTVAPGKTIRFAPGGYHLMLMHRNRTLHVGDSVPIRLHFASGHDLEVKFKVGGAGIQ
ncbi:MAG: copper chaperone PCu(A)C [Gammaproteobacteria bacterium]